MYKIYRKLFIIIFIFMFLLFNLLSPVLAVTASERQELIDLLNEYESDLGNLIEFKLIVDKTYTDLHSVSSVDDSLKETLRADIDMLDTVTDLNPLILTVLKVELNSQVDKLTNSNLHEMQEEIEIIKEWSDQKAADLGYTDTPNNNEDINQDQPTEEPNEEENQNVQTNTTLPQEMQQVITSLPYAGTSSIIIGFIILLIISAIISIIRYKQLKDAK